MKLLLENWRQYIKEDEAGHFPWLKDLKDLDTGPRLADRLKDRLQSGDDRFKILGAGSFRTVWSPRGDEDHVIKVVHDNDNDKLQMNKDDFETAKRYPFIFPKAYAHADDFSWIVMEKTPPLIYPEDMQKVLDQSFPAEQKALLNALSMAEKDSGFGGAEGAWWAQWNPADPFHIMKMIMGSFRFGRDMNEAVDPTVVTARHGRGTNKDTTTALNLQKILAPVAGAAYQELSKAMHEFAIDKYEIGRGNIGHDKDYNFKIVDSSVFDPNWDPEPEYFVDAKEVEGEWAGRWTKTKPEKSLRHPEADVKT